MAQIPIIEQTGLSFRETFRTVGDVIENGGEVGANVVISEGGTNSGTGGITYDKAHIPAQGEFSIYIKVTSTDLSATNGLVGQYYDVVGERFLVSLNTSGNALVQIGGSTVTTANSVSAGTEASIFVTRDSANLVSVVLNDGTAATSTISTDVDQQALTLLFYDEGGTNAPLVGTMLEFRVYSIALSTTEMTDISSATGDATFNFEGQALLNLPLRSQYNDGAGQVVKNIGTLGGTLVLNAASIATQINPHGLSFDGTTNEELTSTDSGLQLTGDVTLGCQIKVLAEPGSDKWVFSHGAAGEAEADNNLYGLLLDSVTQKWQYFHEYGSGSDETNVFTTAAAVNVGTLYHIYLVRDDTAKTVKLYIDGEEIETFTYTNSATGGTSGSFVMASQFGIDGTEINAEIFKPRMFNFALTSTQMKWLSLKDISLLNV